MKQPNSNSELYKFSDFTFDNYRKLIQLAKTRFRFVNYNIDFEKKTNFIIWRHDVEFSVRNACRLAQIEKEENVKSTFFLQLHSEYYNVLDKRNIDSIRKNIIESGHSIGLHFDIHYHEIGDSRHIDKYLLKDKEILEDIFKVSLQSFSFHNTNSFILNCENDYYGGLVNVYSRRIKNIPYCSDSLGYWRYERLQDMLENRSIKKLQVLTHDAMWSEKALSPRQRIRRSIQQDADDLMVYYDNYLLRFGHKNIDEN